MRYTKSGNSNLSISRICLGCMGFGESGSGQHSWTVDEAHSREILHRALELTLTAEELTYLEEPYVPSRFGRGYGAEHRRRERVPRLVYRQSKNQVTKKEERFHE